LSGAGATIVSLLGYAVERNLATKEKQAEFGKGSIKGPAPPETANNEACTGSFVPLLTLNVSPGPRMMIDEPQIFWSVIMSMFIGNLVLLILNLPLIPCSYQIPFILFFTLMGLILARTARQSF